MPSPREENLSPTALLFDPNNYRFQDIDGFVIASEERFHEETVQAKANQRLRQDEGLQALKASILRNGYIGVERMVVRPCRHSGGKWVVIEGNRRLAAVRWVLEDHDAGATIPPSILQTIRVLPAFIVEEESPDEIFRASLMGIRHVSGIKEWGGYQRAKLVASMRDQLQLEAAEVAERLGMTAHEVNRRYRAFKAFQQMQEEEDYSEYAKPSMYPIFHEAVSIPNVRSWLGWEENSNEFVDAENRRHFYGLITPSQDEDENEVPPKITTYSNVRELRHVLDNPDAQRLLLDPTRSFHDAINVCNQEKLSHLWAAQVSAAIRSLETMVVKELKSIGQKDVELLKRLHKTVEERLQDHQSLVRSNSQ